MKEKIMFSKNAFGGVTPTTYVNPLQEAGISNIDFDYLQQNNVGLSQVVHLDLSITRTNKQMFVRGTFLQVLNLTSGGTLKISFNKASENITFDGEQQWESPFFQIFVTNTAQAGFSCDLIIMTNGRYTPYYRTKAISPVVSSSPTVGEVTVGAVAVLVSASNLLRRTVYLQSMLTNVADIYLGTTNAVTVLTGFPLFIGGQNQFLEPYYTGDIYAITSVANQKIRTWINYE